MDRDELREQLRKNSQAGNKQIKLESCGIIWKRRKISAPRRNLEKLLDPFQEQKEV